MTSGPIQSGPILVVDDDARHARSVCDLLAAYDLRAEPLHDASRALDVLADGAYELLILDLNMPGVSGLDVLRALLARNLDVRTIVYSGEESLANITPILRLGAFDFVRKSATPAELLGSVRSALEQNRLQRENAAISARADRSNTLHRFLVESSPDLIYVLDSDGCFDLANNPLRDLFGADGEALRGQHWTTLFQGQVRCVPPPQGVATLAENPVEPAAATLEGVALLRHRFDERRRGRRATQHFEFDYIAPDGHAHILELSAMGLYERAGRLQHTDDVGRFAGTYGVLRNVTAARSEARKAEVSRLKFQGLFMNSPDAMYIARLRDGHIMEANANFARIARAMGAEAPESDQLLWPAEERRQEFLDGLQAHPEHFSSQIERVWANETRHFFISGRLLRLDGELMVLATLRDVTNERRMEQERLQLESQFHQASRMDAIRQLAGGIAHDFNNILASIIGYTELLQLGHRRLPDERIDNYLKEVITAGSRARDLISQMLAFTRAMRGEPREVSVRECLDTLSEVLRAAVHSTIALDYHYEDDTPSVLIDPLQLQQIVINLLMNAQDAIGENGRIDVRVSTTASRETCAGCGAEVTGDWVEISVSDTGHGVQPELRQKIFEIFETTRSPDQGTGIGLWLINTLVHEYGGHVTLDSAPGAGARFAVRLPDAAACQQAPVERPSLNRRGSIDGLVLVVDDNVSVSGYVSEALHDNGYQARVYNDPAAARAYLEDPANDVAVLVSDLVMPQMSGLELSARAHEIRPDLPIVLISGYADTTSQAEIERSGVRCLLKKPFLMEDLLAALESVV